MRNPHERKFEEYIKPYIADKSVLDVGCVEHDIENRASDEWIHDMIIEHAADVLGVDILEEDIEALRREGYNVTYGDIKQLDLDETFDVVFMGEVIEHLENFRDAFESVEHHLVPGGKVVITTPNALAIGWVLRRFAGMDFVNPEHTCWFDRETLGQLLGRFGFEVEEVAYARMSRFRWHPLWVADWTLETILPDRAANRSIIVVATQEDD